MVIIGHMSLRQHFLLGLVSERRCPKEMMISFVLLLDVEIQCVKQPLYSYSVLHGYSKRRANLHRCNTSPQGIHDR